VERGAVERERRVGVEVPETEGVADTDKRFSSNA